MNTLLYYLLQVIVASGLLYGYYHLVLRNKKFHQYNRFYLLATIVISILIPFLNIPVYFTAAEKESSVVLRALTAISSPGPEEVILYNPDFVKEPETNWFTRANLSYAFYTLIAAIVFIRIIFSLLKIKSIIKNNPVEKLDAINFVNTNEPGTPFSFFRWLFWNNKIELRSQKGEQIFRHEFFHIEHRHSADILLTELLTVIFWINPFFHLIKKEIKAIHEFLADKFAINENQQWDYAELLLMQALNTQTRLVNPFFHNQIKRRIAMITSSQKPGQQYLRKLMVLPVAAIVLALAAFSYKEKNKIPINDKDISVSGYENFKDTAKKPVPDTIAWIQDITPPAKRSPSLQQLKAWADQKMYGVWLDGKRISNSELVKYKPSDFGLYNVSKLAKNAVNYGKHFYQIDLLTHQYYDKSYQTIKPGITKYIATGDTTPLYNSSYSNSLIVIDGTIKDNMNSKDLDEQIDPNSIESISVLKGNSATAKYGDKGKNGVIEIKTKKDDTREVEVQDLRKTDTVKPVADNKIFVKVEIEPSFPGGEAGFKRYVAVQQKNYESKFSLTDFSGSVQVQFIVHTDSTISDVRALDGAGESNYGKAAVELIKKGPRWLPAIQNGRIVPAYKTQTVTFIPVDSKLPTEAQWQKASNVTPKIPEISITDLKNATVFKLLQMEEGTEITSFIFTIDLANGDISQVPNYGARFSPATTELIQNAVAGRLITIDRIRITLDGKEKKIASKVYQVVE